MANKPEVVNAHARQFISSLGHFEACVHDSASISRPILIKFVT